MKVTSALLGLIFATFFAGSLWAAETAPKTKTLCGWFQNPTPGNVWLQDRNAEWVVGIQGGHQAQGDWPEFSDSQWVKTNRSYGYGCACIRGVVNDATHEVISIADARAKPLDVCRKDNALKKPAG